MGFIQKIGSLVQVRKYMKQLEQFDYLATYKDLGLQEKENQYILQSNHFNRGKQYVKSFGLMGLSFGKLIKRKLHSNEVERLILLSHLAPVYDDLFDKLNTPKKRVVELLENPYLTGDNEEERLFLLFYRPLFKALNDKREFMSCFLLLTDAQEYSKQQITGELNLQSVLKITADKGGHSALLLFSLLDAENAYEKELYQLGACCQYMDDIFDWHDDTTEQRTTIANMMGLKELTDFYKAEKQKTINGFKNQFGPLVNTLLSPGDVCLEFYRSKGVNTLSPPQTRVVCDMEKLGNIFKLVFS